MRELYILGIALFLVCVGVIAWWIRDEMRKR